MRKNIVPIGNWLYRFRAADGTVHIIDATTNWRTHLEFRVPQTEINILRTKSLELYNEHQSLQFTKTGAPRKKVNTARVAEIDEYFKSLEPLSAEWKQHMEIDFEISKAHTKVRNWKLDQEAAQHSRKCAEQNGLTNYELTAVEDRNGEEIARGYFLADKYLVIIGPKDWRADGHKHFDQQYGKRFRPIKRGEPKAINLPHLRFNPRPRKRLP